MRTLVLIFAAMLFSSSAHCASDDQEKLSLISEIVVNTRFAFSLKEGLKVSPKANAEDAHFKSRIIALPDDILVPLIAEVYRNRMTLEEAREVAAFYRSAAGRKLIAVQSRNLGTADPQYRLTADEYAMAQRFSNSATTAAYRKASTDPAFFSDLTKILTDYLLKNP